MPVHNIDIAHKFKQMADLLEIQGANRFRVRAYRTAARNIKTSRDNIRDLADDLEKLQEIPGIGQELAEKIQTIVNTGELPQLQDLKQELPAGLLELLDVEGLGPKRVKKLYQELGIKNTQELEVAAKEKRIQRLDGFGEKIERKILQRVLAQDDGPLRTLRINAQQVIEPLLAYLEAINVVEKVAVAGSYRRKKETVGDIDIIAVSQQGAEISQAFVDYEDVERILNKGHKKSSVVLRTGLQVDLRIVAQESFGAAMQYFTGSRDHNIVMRQRAIDYDCKLNEYGLFQKQDDGQEGQKLAGPAEKKIYDQLNLAFIPPEIRENRGEIEIASNNQLPKLIMLDDIKGDLQMHTTASDGRDSLEDMVAKARQLGYEYIAITDHSQHLKVANGLDSQRFQEQAQAIDDLNQQFDDFQILKAAEVDILKDGSLDLDEEALAKFDLVLCAIHSHFNLSEQEQTQRVVTAMQSPFFHIFSHPTGRLINKREPYRLDFAQIMQAAHEHNCILEINAQPDRLDLNDVLIQQAIERGVKLSLGTDAHSTDGLEYMQLGVDQARRGWAEAKDIINTLSWPEIQDIIARKN